MSFATLEEAWGLPAFDAAPAALTAAPYPAAPAGPPAAHRQARPRFNRTPFSELNDPEPLPHDSFAPAPQPRREEDDLVIRETRRFLARAYARYGMAGVLRLLPPEAVGQMGKQRRRGGGGGAGGLWGQLVVFLSSPEKMLLTLLCIFAVLVVWDNWQSQQAAASAASLASLHMSAPTMMQQVM